MAEKKCPVDRGKLLIGLECCRGIEHVECRWCPYLHPASKSTSGCIGDLETDALAYIGWLEAGNERLRVSRYDGLSPGLVVVDELEMLRNSKEATENAGNDHEGRQDPDDA